MEDFRDIPVEDVKRDYERKSNTVKAFLEDRCIMIFKPQTILLLREMCMMNIRSIANREKKDLLDANILGVKLKEAGIEKERIRTREQENIITQE